MHSNHIVFSQPCCCGNELDTTSALECLSEFLSIELEMEFVMAGWLLSNC
jgi:hypothetical protein